jgi:hypothetical protein
VLYKGRSLQFTSKGGLVPSWLAKPTEMWVGGGGYVRIKIKINPRLKNEKNARRIIVKEQHMKLKVRQLSLKIFEKYNYSIFLVSSLMFS